jgi:hypothetical protein
VVATPLGFQATPLCLWSSLRGAIAGESAVRLADAVALAKSDARLVRLRASSEHCARCGLAILFDTARLRAQLEPYWRQPVPCSPSSRAKRRRARRPSTFPRIAAQPGNSRVRSKRVWGARPRCPRSNSRFALMASATGCECTWAARLAIFKTWTVARFFEPRSSSRSRSRCPRHGSPIRGQRP